jgi:hypothetical protein
MLLLSFPIPLLIIRFSDVLSAPFIGAQIDYSIIFRVGVLRASTLTGALLGFGLGPTPI